jgi:hypothetical protein
MRYDDFFEDDTTHDDGDAVSGTLYFLGTAQIYALFQSRAVHFPEMADSTFFALVEAMLKPFEEFMYPQEFEELREMVSMTQRELGEEREPAAKHDACKDQVNQRRGRPRQAGLKPPGPVRSRKRRPR